MTSNASSGGFIAATCGWGPSPPRDGREPYGFLCFHEGLGCCRQCVQTLDLLCSWLVVDAREPADERHLERGKFELPPLTVAESQPINLASAEPDLSYRAFCAASATRKGPVAFQLPAGRRLPISSTSQVASEVLTSMAFAMELARVRRALLCLPE